METYCINIVKILEKYCINIGKIFEKYLRKGPKTPTGGVGVNGPYGTKSSIIYYISYNEKFKKPTKYNHYY